MSEPMPTGWRRRKNYSTENAPPLEEALAQATEGPGRLRVATSLPNASYIAIRTEHGTYICCDLGSSGVQWLSPEELSPNQGWRPL